MLQYTHFTVHIIVINKQYCSDDGYSDEMLTVIKLYTFQAICFYHFALVSF